MSEYLFLGTAVEFTESAERIFDYWSACSLSIHLAGNEFSQWYENESGIQFVLQGYKAKASELVVKYSVKVLLEQLTNLEIYDISRESYANSCLYLRGIENAHGEVGRSYQRIVAQQEAEQQYRAIRKQARGRVIGGGFGLGGAIKGMATAGAINAVTGAGHSLFNSIGNAGSSFSAASRKSSLYESDSTYQVLFDAIEDAIIYAYEEHLSLVNSRIEDYYRSSFNSDKGRALFESATKVPEKEKELLVESFTYSPGNYDLYKYVFYNYPEERKSIIEVGERFGIDLSREFENILAKEYTQAAKESEEEAIAAKKRILDIMAELDIKECKVLKQIEKDCIDRLCADYEPTDFSEKKKAFLDAFVSYDASDVAKKNKIKDKLIWELAKQYEVELTEKEISGIIKKLFTDEAKASEEIALKVKADILRIMNEFGLTRNSTFNSLEISCLHRLCPDYDKADEETCRKYIEAVNSYDALEENKKFVTDKIHARIEKIWAAEDGKIFDNILLTTDITSDEEIGKAIKYIESKGRTGNAEKYIKALRACHPSNIKKAMWSFTPMAKATKALGWVFILLAAASYFLLGLPFVVSLILVAIGSVPIFLVSTYKEIWDTITLNGKVVNPVVDPKNQQ